MSKHFFNNIYKNANFCITFKIPHKLHVGIHTMTRDTYIVVNGSEFSFNGIFLNLLSYLYQLRQLKPNLNGKDEILQFLVQARLKFSYIYIYLL